MYGQLFFLLLRDVDAALKESETKKVVDVLTVVLKAPQGRAALQSYVNTALANGQYQTLSPHYKFENVNWQSGGEVTSQPCQTLERVGCPQV